MTGIHSSPKISTINPCMPVFRRTRLDLCVMYVLDIAFRIFKQANVFSASHLRYLAFYNSLGLEYFSMYDLFISGSTFLLTHIVNSLNECKMCLLINKFFVMYLLSTSSIGLQILVLTENQNKNAWLENANIRVNIHS